MLQISEINYIVTVVLALIVFTVMRVGKQSIKNACAAGLTVSYMYFVLAVTVLSRGPTEHPFNWFPPFWAYTEIIKRSSIAGSLAKQILMNIFMLAPLGFLIPIAINRNPLPVGIAFSLLIETLQYVTKRGYFELDDLIHNAIGVFLGYMLYQFIKNAIRNKPEKKNEP